MTSVEWLEVRVRGSEDKASYCQVLLQQHGFSGWVEESEGPQGFAYLVYLAQEPGWQERLAALQADLASWQVDVTTHDQVRDEDWAENWKRFYHPLEVGRTLVICPSWETFAVQPHHRMVTLDPGSAFGTGYHATTRLCLELLEDTLESRLLEPMLDMGTGSGILAIAAHRLGVRKLLAVDNDPVAVKVARENLAINQITGVEVALADRPTGGPYALITANLVAALLTELAAGLAKALAPGGCLICGGIIRERAELVKQAMQQCGLRLLQERSQDDWVSLLLERP